MNDGTGPANPIPPIYLIERVSALGDRTDDQKREDFVASGQQSLAELERLLGYCGRPISSFRSILDWGCGPGRVTMRLLERYPTLDVTGVDTDNGSISWLQRNAPSGQYLQIDPAPPTPLADEQFDLVLNHSVLTHLDEPSQRAWLAEIARVLQPDGWFVTSTHGVHAFINQLQYVEKGFGADNPWIRQWNAARFVFVSDDAFIGSGHHDGYHTTFQEPWTLESFSDFRFELLHVAFRADLGFQDYVVVRRRTDDEVDQRRAIELRPEPGAPQNLEPQDDDSRLARLERNMRLIEIAMNRIGRQIGRVEESIDARDHEPPKQSSPAAPTRRRLPAIVRGRVRNLWRDK